MKHTNQAIGSVPTSARIVLDVSGEQASSAVNGTLYSILSADGQIAFPSTQNPSTNPNVLDDYREGTTTPVVTAGAGTFTSVNCEISYTKIGNRFNFSGLINVVNNGTAASFIIVPMPFVAAKTSGCGGRNTTSSMAISGAIGAGTSNLILVRYDATYPVTTGQSLAFSGNYVV